MHNDLTFFTNEPERTLYDRFNKILNSHTQFFDILVGYFRTSGFYMMYPAMKNIEKIRILVGINVDKKTSEMISNIKQGEYNLLSHKGIKDEFSKKVKEELDESEDKIEIEEGIKVFIEWIKSGKLEMKIYPHDLIHAKVYIMRKNLKEVPDQYGSVITGSSNFSMSGLKNNLEFNVELKDSRDVDFALENFEKLWRNSIDISKDYVDTVINDTWVNDKITPYELYLKTIYEYFKEEINDDKSLNDIEYLPDGFMALQYQRDAVIQAKKILEAYNGVFISDVVGLGKTFISAMLGQKLRGSKLVICPPVLVDYWRRTLLLFGVSAKVESLGKLDKILSDKEILNRTEYVFVDEAHRFRNKDTENYRKLHEICFGKKVILISATPQNNYATDIANQIYLFQPRNNSTIIPNRKDLEGFFRELENRLKSLEKGSKEYEETLKLNSEIIRNNVLKNIMIRRTRTEIETYYSEDLKKQGLKFPEVNKPHKIVYKFDLEIEDIFNRTIEAIKKLSYARYKPLTYLKESTPDIKSQIIGQMNMSGFMKSLLIKRLESSFYAFKQTLYRFVKSYEKFIEMLELGTVYISKDVNVYEFIDNENDKKLDEYIQNEIIRSFNTDMFDKHLIEDLNNDLNIFKFLYSKWMDIDKDPKLDTLLNNLNYDKNFKNKKIIIFTESKETAEYLGHNLEKIYKDEVIIYTGDSSIRKREIIEANFNPDFQVVREEEKNILITTDVLSEGINLHRSNIIINYDLPWNPTRVMQRIGRINRVGTKHDSINIYNFFPTDQSNSHLTLEDNIKSKIQSFHDTLGDDFKYLSEDEEVSAHNLYERLNSDIELKDGDLDSNLKYLSEIRFVRDNDQKLYNKIKHLPKKSTSGKKYKNVKNESLVTYFKKGDLKKFFISNGKETRELFFDEALKYIKSNKNEKREKKSSNFYQLLEKNKKYFKTSLEEETISINKGQVNRNQKKIIKYLKSIRNYTKFTNEESNQIKNFIEIFQDGVVPNKTINEILGNIEKQSDPICIYKEIKETLPKNYMNNIYGKNECKDLDTEVVLSCYLVKENCNEY